MYKQILKCRICGNTNLTEILDLGEQSLTGVFPKDENANVEKSPLVLVKCMEDTEGNYCGLVQLKHSHNPGDMYGENYGYRSGLNQFMVKHLQNKTKKIEKLIELNENDIVIDIGSNDGTLLRSYSNKDTRLIGIDPSGERFRKYYPKHIELIPDFFSKNVVKSLIGEQKAKVITSIAMFYDLEDPMIFAEAIYDSLEKNGIWVFEQSYLTTMIQACSYDTICHEHLEYYRMKQIKWILDKIGFTIIDVELNGINGGSFSIIASKQGKGLAESAKVQRLIGSEYNLQLDTLKPYINFSSRIIESSESLKNFITKENATGKLIIGYGASTKGNVMLQYCGFTEKDIPYISEVNENKFGCFTPGTRIPIISEAEAQKLKADYYLVLPWHFKSFIINKEEKFLESGGKLIFPLPEFLVI